MRVWIGCPHVATCKVQRLNLDKDQSNVFAGETPGQFKEAPPFKFLCLT